MHTKAEHLTRPTPPRWSEKDFRVRHNIPPALTMQLSWPSEDGKEGKKSSHRHHPSTRQSHIVTIARWEKLLQPFKRLLSSPRIKKKKFVESRITKRVFFRCSAARPPVGSSRMMLYNFWSVIMLEVKTGGWNEEKTKPQPQPCRQTEFLVNYGHLSIVSMLLLLTCFAWTTRLSLKKFFLLSTSGMTQIRVIETLSQSAGGASQRAA